MDTLRRFEGASLDELLAFIYRECGESAQIVEANRVRRGGVGGFFAKEGYEVVVSAEDDGTPAHAAVGSSQLAESMAEPPRPWMRMSGATQRAQAAHVARALDDEAGDQLIGDVAATLGGVKDVADAASIEHAIGREAAQLLRAGQLASPAHDLPPAQRTPVAPIRADIETTGDPLLGLVDETNHQDQRDHFTFDRALEQAMADGPSAPTLSLDDLLALDLEPIAPATTEPPAAPAPGANERPAKPGVIPASQLVDDFMRQSDVRFTSTRLTDEPSDPVVAALVARLVELPPTTEPTVVDASGPASIERELDTTDTSITSDTSVATDTSVASDMSDTGDTGDATPLARPTTFELVARYERLPGAPAVPTAPGIVLVIGALPLALRTADQLAASTPAAPTQVVAASAEPGDVAPSWSVVRTVDDALDRADRGRRRDERTIMAVDLGHGPAGLLWAKRLIDRLDPGHVHLAVSTGDANEDTRAAIELVGGVDAIALHHDVDTPIDPDAVLSLDTPIASIDGHPTSPALWAALTLEGADHGR